MKSILILLIAMITNQTFAKTIVVSNHELGVEITLVDSEESKPIVSIRDNAGTDYGVIVKGINEVIANDVFYCHEDGILGAVDELINCDYIGFEPVDAKIVPYYSFSWNHMQNDLALVIKGKISGSVGEEIFFIPIQSLIEKHRNTKRIWWTLTNGGVTTLHGDKEFDPVNVDKIFRD